MNRNKGVIFAIVIFFASLNLALAQQVDYTVVSVQEEGALEFTKITKTGDYVCLPLVKRSKTDINWISNRILGINKEGTSLAYLSFRNNSTNIFIKNLDKQGASRQRTNRSNILDFSYSPDGKQICFSEKRGNTNQIFQTAAENGYICRQITSGDQDYSPIYSADMDLVFFSRAEANGISIWSYNVSSNYLSSYSVGMNPFPLKDKAFICSRQSSSGRSEIWIINYETGIEECIYSDPNHSFTSPTVSPDGEWILFVGDSKLQGADFTYYNTDLFVCRIDGTGFAQLTYHAADDLSPIWSNDGQHIYFISQRGDADGTANVWRMNFPYYNYQ